MCQKMFEKTLGQHCFCGKVVKVSNGIPTPKKFETDKNLSSFDFLTQSQTKNCFYFLEMWAKNRVRKYWVEGYVNSKES